MSSPASHTRPANSDPVPLLSDWHDRVALAACLLTLLIALLIAQAHLLGTYGEETDFYGAYMEEAKNILAGRPYTYRHNPPGYMLLLAVVSQFTSDFFSAGKIITAISTALFGWLAYLLQRALFGPRVALAATLLLLIAMTRYSFLAAMDAVGAVTILLPLWIYLRTTIASRTQCFASGILCGLAYLTRYTAIFVVVGVAISILLLDHARVSFRHRIAKFGLYSLGVGICTIPWLVINWRLNGAPFSSTAYLQIAAHFYNPQGDGSGDNLQLAAAQFVSLTDVLMHDPVAILKRYLKDIYWYAMQLVTEAVQFPGYLFAGAGLVFMAHDGDRRRLVYGVICTLGFLQMILVGFYLRYYLFAFPALFALVAYFLFHPKVDRPLRTPSAISVRFGWVMIAATAVLLTLRTHAEVRDILSTEPRHLLEVAEWLRSQSSPSDGIVVRKPHLARLAGLESTFPLVNTAAEFHAAAISMGARYVVYSDYEAELWSGLAALQDPETVGEGFRLVYTHPRPRLLIYEVVRQ